MKTKRKQNNKFMKLLAISLVLVLSLSLGLGCASPDNTCYACEDCAVSDMALNEGDSIAVGALSCDDCGCGGNSIYCEDCTCGDGIATISEYIGIDESEEDTLYPGTLESYSYDIGFAVYEYDESDLTAENADVMTASYSPTVTGDADVTISASVQYPSDAAGSTGYMQVYYLGPDDSTFSELLTTPITVIQSIVASTTYTGSYTLENLEAGMHKVILKFYTSDSDVNAVYTTASTIIVSGSVTEMSTISAVSMTSGTDKVVSFTHGTNGELGELSYIWYLNNAAYEVTEDPSITLNALEAGIYTMFCKVVPEVGISTNTNSFTVTVAAAAVEGGITIVSQPSNVQVKEGEAAVVSIALEAEDSSSVLSYAWYINNTAISGNNSPTLSINGLSAGSYSVYCDVSIDGEYSFTSSTATITVAAASEETDTDTDTDVTVEDEEDETFLTKAGNFYDENTTLVWVLGIIAVCGIFYVVSKKK